MKVHDLQVVTLTYAAASEAIAEAFNNLDWKRDAVSDLSEAILKRIGFQVPS